MATGIPESILYIAGIMMAVAFMGVFAAVIGDSTDRLESSGRDVRQSLATDITLLNDPEQMDTSPLVLYLRNHGDTTLVTADMTVLLDGTASGDLTLDVLGEANDEIWPPGTLLEITVNDLTVAAGQHHVRVLTAGGVQSNLEFVA